MKKQITWLYFSLILLPVLSLNSCFPCLVSFYGKVVNETTKQPLKGVKIVVYFDEDYKEEFFTDSTGTFKADGKPHSTFTKGCKELKLAFSKDSFQQYEYSEQRSTADSLIISLRPL